MYVDDIGFRLIPIMAKMRLRMAGWRVDVIQGFYSSGQHPGYLGHISAHSIMDICSRNVCI